MFPKYDIDKIKYSVDDITFEKAVDLYNNKKVKNFQFYGQGFSAIVEGTKKYNVGVSLTDINRGACDCYLGQNGVLCKHIIALGIYAVLGGTKMKKEDMKPIGELKPSDIIGELNEAGLEWFKGKTLEALKYLKPYLGPSKTWDANQASLAKGCNMLTDIFNKIPISVQTAELIIKTLLKVDKKLSNTGIDDSNGIVGGFLENAGYFLKDFARIDPECIKKFKLLCKQEISFDWNKPLLESLENIKEGGA